MNSRVRGIVQGMHNLNRSIESFAHCCFKYALDTKQDLWFATKDTISKKYDHTFKDIFQEIFDRDYKTAFEKAGIDLFLYADRRRGGTGDQVRGRLYLGLQEL